MYREGPISSYFEKKLFKTPSRLLIFIVAIFVATQGSKAFLSHEIFLDIWSVAVLVLVSLCLIGMIYDTMWMLKHRQK